MDRARAGRTFASQAAAALLGALTAIAATGATAAQANAKQRIAARRSTGQLPAPLRTAQRPSANRIVAPINDELLSPAQGVKREPEELISRPLEPQPMDLESSPLTTTRVHEAYSPRLDSFDGSDDSSCPCGDDSCVGCGSLVDCGSACGGCIPGLRFTAGFELTFVQPRFDDNVGLSVMEATGTTLETFRDREFDYDFDVAPRLFLGAGFEDGIGLRAMYWQYDEQAKSLREQPLANGQGLVSPPPFLNIDISSNVAADVFTAATGLNAYTIDVEATKEGRFAAWRFGMAAGVRYASVDQTYLTELRNTGNVLRGRIDYRHRSEGVGPTLSLSSSLPVTQSVDLFASGRGALLFGQATSRLVAGEDLDLSTPLTTVRDTERDDLLPTAELQLGLRWAGCARGRAAWRPYGTLAMESQHYSGVGNAVSEVGALGFFGFAVGGGVTW